MHLIFNAPTDFSQYTIITDHKFLRHSFYSANPCRRRHNANRSWLLPELSELIAQSINCPVCKQSQIACSMGQAFYRTLHVQVQSRKYHQLMGLFTFTIVLIKRTHLKKEEEEEEKTKKQQHGGGGGAHQTWAEAGVSRSRSRSLLNFRSRSLDSFQVRSQSLGYEAETKAKAEARLFVENQMQIWKDWFQSRSFGKPRSRSLWRSRSRSQSQSQAPQNLGSRSLDPKKAGFMKPKPASAHVWCSLYS